MPKRKAEEEAIYVVSNRSATGRTLVIEATPEDHMHILAALCQGRNGGNQLVRRCW
eukprot:gene28066-51462_t